MEAEKLIAWKCYVFMKVIETNENIHAVKFFLESSLEWVSHSFLYPSFFLKRANKDYKIFG